MVFGTNQPSPDPGPAPDARAAARPGRPLRRPRATRGPAPAGGLQQGGAPGARAIAPAIVALPASRIPPEQKAQEAARLQGAIGLAALRLGEQENCLLNHRATSCLFPIDRGGVHTLQGGARRAIEAFTRRLAAEPSHATTTWLLNIAYMTVGEYPDKVPRQWLIPPEVFESEYDIKRFPDVAMAVGCRHGRAWPAAASSRTSTATASWTSLAPRGGCAISCGSSGTTARAVSTDRTREAGLAGQLGGINLTHADYNNDGRPDVYVMRGGWLREAGLHPDSLLRNNGDGTFEDVTEAAGLLSLHPTHSSGVGRLRQRRLRSTCSSATKTGERSTHPVQLFHNNRDGTFTDRGQGLRLRRARRREGRGLGRLQQRRLLDLYVSRVREAEPAVPQRRESGSPTSRQKPASANR